MKKIPLMDLKRQYKQIKEPVKQKIDEVLESGHFIMGNNVKEFELKMSEYLKAKYIISVGNGTDALVIALKALGIKEGDEIITPAMSFFATAEAITTVGATPVFVDIEEDYHTLDPQKIEEKITSKTKAILPVHLYGQASDINAINQIAKQYNLYVIEDAAQAIGGTYKGKKICTLSDIAAVSFFPTKNLGCYGDGGMIITNNEKLATICKALRVHGSGIYGKKAFQYLHPDTKEIKPHDEYIEQFQETKYYNSINGYNSRLDEIQAAILNVKLPYLQEWNARRRAIARKYSKEIKNDLIVLPKEREESNHVYYVFPIMIKGDREIMKTYLEEKGIGTGIYFPIPLHLQRVFESQGYKKGDFPNAEKLAEQGMTIPIYPELAEEEVNYIIRVINEYVK